MTFPRILAAAAAGAALVVAPLTPALGQETETTPEVERAVPDALLDSFIVAALSVSEIAESYQGRMQSAEDDAARQALASEAQAEMVAAVEETDGITVEEYMNISQAARADEELNQRLMDKLAEQAPAE